MKIMMVITGMRSGGAERVMSTLCNELVSRHSVRLLSIKEAASDYYIDKRVEFIGGNVSNQNLFKSVRIAKQQIDEWRPDVILSFMTKSNIIALLAGIFSKRKPSIVIAERGNPYESAKIFKIIRRFLYPYAQGCVFQTEDAQEYYKNILKCKSVILKNPLNPDFNIEPYTGERKKKIVTVGRLSVEKNQKLLIDAFAKIASDYPEYTLEIYGEGPLRAELEAYIRKYGLADRIILMGRKDKVQEYIQDAEIFVLPSNSEGMPNALLEAMALGIPSIATDCPIGGSAFIINNNENGILIPMNDTEALKESIIKCLTEREFAAEIGKRATAVSKDFTPESVCKEWEAYLQEIGNKKGKR